MRVASRSRRQCRPLVCDFRVEDVNEPKFRKRKRHTRHVYYYDQVETSKLHYVYHGCLCQCRFHATLEVSTTERCDNRSQPPDPPSRTATAGALRTPNTCTDKQYQMYSRLHAHSTFTNASIALVVPSTHHLILVHSPLSWYSGMSGNGSASQNTHFSTFYVSSANMSAS